MEVSEGIRILSEDDSFIVLTYNTGYGALSRGEDFFMDGGSKVRPDSKDVVGEKLAGISAILKEQDADFYFLQEVEMCIRDSRIAILLFMEAGK